MVLTGAPCELVLLSFFRNERLSFKESKQWRRTPIFLRSRFLTVWLHILWSYLKQFYRSIQTNFDHVSVFWKLFLNSEEIKFLGFWHKLAWSKIKFSLLAKSLFEAFYFINKICKSRIENPIGWWPNFKNFKVKNIHDSIVLCSLLVHLVHLRIFGGTKTSKFELERPLLVLKKKKKDVQFIAGMLRCNVKHENLLLVLLDVCL